MQILYWPFSMLMKGCLFVANNSYLFALLFFALVIQILLLPLAIKQQKSSIMAAKLRPKEMAIREKYKGRNDRTTQQKMTMEIQEMYQQSGYSQFAGCLPLLVQIPVIFILFTIVRNPISYATNIENFDVTAQSAAAVEFYNKEKEMLNKDAFEEGEYDELIGQIQTYQQSLGCDNNYAPKESDTGKREMELSRLIIDGRENLNSLVEEGKINPEIVAVYEATGFESYKDQLPDYKIGSVNLIDEPDFNGNPWLLLIPLFVFLTSFISTKLTRKFSAGATQTDANGNPMGGGLFMEVGMPLMSAIFTFSFAGAIGVYWIWRTLIGMLQSFIMAKALPIPKVSEEEIAAARAELKSSQKNKKKKVITIEVDEDDDSYDDLVVNKESKTKTIDVTQRTPRKIEMLSDEDDE